MGGRCQRCGSRLTFGCPAVLRGLPGSGPAAGAGSAGRGGFMASGGPQPAWRGSRGHSARLPARSCSPAPPRTSGKRSCLTRSPVSASRPSDPRHSTKSCSTPLPSGRFASAFCLPPAVPARLAIWRNASRQATSRLPRNGGSSNGSQPLTCLPEPETSTRRRKCSPPPSATPRRSRYLTSSSGSSA
jgi:hypothetical protein